MSRRHLGTIVLLTGANGIAALSSSGVAVLATLALGRPTGASWCWSSRSPAW